jgi:thymidylate synthase
MTATLSTTTPFEAQYIHILHELIEHGSKRVGRNGIVYSEFAKHLEFDLSSNEFPLLLGRRIFYKGVLGELAAMLRGPKTLKDFEDFGCNYWQQWANPDGSIALDYGNRWLDFDGVNQLKELVERLKTNPYDRRHIVTGWHPATMKTASLPCCHMLYQWYVRDKTLDMLWYQRSADWMVGVPSDAVFAAAWLIALANEVGLTPGKVCMTFGDAHVYDVHLTAVNAYVAQYFSLPSHAMPTFRLAATVEAPHTQFEPNWIVVQDYAPAAAIKLEVVA